MKIKSTKIELLCIGQTDALRQTVEALILIPTKIFGKVMMPKFKFL
jgi:hypothetical protein